jgi:hypothetical protein
MSYRSIPFIGRTAALPCASILLAGIFFSGAANANPVAPWLNVPAAEPIQKTAVTVAQHPCADTDLQIVVGQQGARRGYATQEVQMTNRGADACYLSGAPGIQLLPANAAPKALAVHPNASPHVQERTDLAPGDTAVVLIGTPGSCEAAVGPERKVNKRLKIVPPGGGERALEGVHVDTLCGDASILHMHVAQHEAAPTSPLAQLIGTLSLADGVTAGGVSHYTVTLTNPTNSAIPLSPCPSYTQSVSAGGASSSATLQLNCAASGNQIAANSSVTYDMQLNVPANLKGGNAKLSWKLQDGPSVGTLISLH